VANILGGTDAANTSSTTVVKAPKSLTQIFSKGPNFAAIEQSGQDQSRVSFPLGFSKEVLIAKEVFQSSERCCSRFDALADVGVRGERVMDNRAQIFGAPTELYESRTIDKKARRVRSRVRLTSR
jgi:hypothetical protein